MWELYYKLCSCNGFRSLWESFIKVSVGLEADSIFYQFVTKLIMEDLGDKQCNEESPRSLDYEERNALRYTVGYIIHSVLQKIEV